MAIQGRSKRTIMIKIWVDGCDVRFEQVSFVQQMLNADEEFSGQLQFDQSNALRNRNKRKDKGDLERGDRVQADEYRQEPEYPHPGIHLAFKWKDEVVWYSEQGIKFQVDIHRDPELVLLIDDVSGTAPVTVQNAVAIDIENPFDKPFPLISNCGEPVISGAIRADRNNPEKMDSYVENQRYYKYTVTVAGITKPLDPHIEGHYDN
jgi:hypothetical protein